MKDRKINLPSKIKITSSIPFMSGVYDFSKIYGEQHYEERELTYVFNVSGNNNNKFMSKKIEISEWLLNGLKEPLYDSEIQGYYFLAECIEVNFSEKKNRAEMEVKFIAHPFMIANLQEGNDIWDTFNFELDYAQDIKYSVDGQTSITIYNPSACKITPVVVSSSSIEVIKNNITYRFSPGTHKEWRFMLEKGENNLILKGIGTIEFIFKKEVL